jgi:hypothetical protein
LKKVTRQLLPMFYILMFLYVALRAYNVYFTCDEGWTFHAYTNSSVYNIVTFNPVLANNHPLNTLLVKLCSLFSLSEFSLRLPNVLAYILYLYAVSGIVGIYFKQKNVLYYGLVMALCLNPSMSEFFAYARGYGISIALMMVCLYQLMLAYERDHYKKHIHFALGALIIGLYANLVLLNMVLPVFLLAVYIIYLKQGSKNFWKALPAPFIYGVVLLLVVAYPVYILKTGGELYWGGVTNFISDTLASLIEDLFALTRWTIIWGVGVILFLVVLFIAFIILLKGLSKKNRSISNLPFYITPAILVFCTLFLNAEFYLAKVPLLKHRTALFLYPISVLSIFSAIKFYAETRPKWALRFTYGLAIILIGGFLYNMNISESEEWSYNRYNRSVISEMNDDPATETVSFYAERFQGYCINYYLQKDKNQQIAPTPIIEMKDLKNFDYDYLYIFSEQAHYVPANYSLLKAYGDRRFLLYKKQ